MVTGHEVSTAYELGWASLKNGALLERAAERFDVFVTVDQNVQFQQNLGKPPADHQLVSTIEKELARKP